MRTLIFNSYSEFLKRTDKKVNGVDQLFSENNPNYEEDNKTNEGCWNCSSCSYCRDCRYCSFCSSCSSCRYCSECRDCSECSYCRDCRYCSFCSSCSSCRYCSECRDCSEKKGKIEALIPKINDIHQKVLECINQDPSKFDMNSWHSNCGTVHCRAGWIVHLAGKNGRKLEDVTCTCFAALMIYKKSSTIKVPVVRFFEDQETAIKDIERCAKEEINLKG